MIRSTHFKLQKYGKADLKNFFFLINLVRSWHRIIDTAFVDRADIVQYIDLPSREAIYEILRSCLCEIIARGIVENTVRLPPGLQQSKLIHGPLSLSLHWYKSSSLSFSTNQQWQLPRKTSSDAQRILACACWLWLASVECVFHSKKNP